MRTGTDMQIHLARGPIGADVTDVDLGGLSDDDFTRLRALVYERGVVAVRGQELGEEQQVRFARRFGELQKIFIKAALSTRHPELFFVSNVVENGKPIGSMDAGKFWHTDGAYLGKPHNVSMLYAVEVPQEGGKALGDTLFAGMAAAYDALAPVMQQRIDGLRAVHSLHHRYAVVPGKVEPLSRHSEDYPPASHPLAIRHPVTGRRCLYLSEGYTTHIEGLPRDESDELLRQLNRHVLEPQFQHRHQWAPGDLVIWDNRATLHRATFDYGPQQRRVMRRATVAGEALG